MRLIKFKKKLQNFSSIKFLTSSLQFDSLDLVFFFFFFLLNSLDAGSPV